MKLDLNLLKRLLVIDHPSKKEWPMLSAIINECYGIDNLEFEMDHYANIFIKKNTTNPDYYPCVVAHADCVIPHANKAVKFKKNKIIGINPVTGKQIGLGMDDTLGICCAIQMLRELPNLKVCFTTEEEIGFIGAEEASENIEFFCDVSYFIQADRRGGSDLITFTNGIYTASNDWLNNVTNLMVQYKYTEEFGIGTDIGVFAKKLQLSAVNVSCGYYREHTNSEYAIMPEFENCLNFIEAILKTVPTDKQYSITIDDMFVDYKDYKEYPVEDDDYLPCTKCVDFDCMNCPY